MTTDISGHWRGQFFYPSDTAIIPANFDVSSVNFQAWITQSGNTITGETEEDNTFSRFSDATLPAKLDGYIAGPMINFSKKYLGGADARHTVNYNGMLSNNNTTIRGSWSVADWSGTFVMSRNTDTIKSSEYQKETVLA
ncbi:MAG: hypothetical protein JKY25_04735 [Robiginitomaculum sp.]|nr:hypothetical protein [Robiginitomaculum sp.]